MRRELPWRALIAGAAALAVLGLAIAFIARGRPVPDGPQPVAWNRQPCAHCRMLVGEPPYAAQLVSRDGDVAFFDDPGCLFQYLDDHRPAVHQLWFHDGTSERWLSAAEVGFMPAPATPMGYGLMAVPRTTPGAIELDAARARTQARAALGDHP